jgi:SNF2 family DNA or RNA helicase
LPPALIVAPVSLLENWQDEIDKFFNKNALTVGLVYGDKLKELRVPQSSIDSQLVEKGLVKFLKPNWIGNAKIILTTYETLRDLEFSFAAENWSIMICDEAQKIKNPNALVTMAAKKQKVQFKIACTGTPVENTLTDLWCLFDFVQPGFLGGLNEFGRTYSKPIEAKTEVEKQRIAELREKIKPQILRRIKKEVATELKNKIIVNECQSLPISPFQLSIYTQAISLFAKRNESGSRSPFKNHLELLQYLRVICTDPRHIGTESSTLDSIESYRKKAPKLHWLLDTLITIKNKDEKVIVFCEFKGIQRLLRHYINEKFGFAPDIVNGDTQASANHERSRQKRIRDFQLKQGFNIIILSPIAVGYGVNIQKANHVIHYTRTWNPAKEDQATDRAYRIGQEKDVYVYYPIITSKDFATFDVKLHQLLEKRREISDDMLNGSGELTANDFNMSEIVPNEYKNDVNPKVDLDYLLRISPKYLEGLAAALWVKQKYTHVHCTPDSGDDGVDVVAINGAKGVLIQCKSSTTDNRGISWDAIKDVVTGRAFYENNYPDVKFELVCLTNQVFNAKAKEHAELNNVLLVEQNDILVMLKKYSITVQDIELFLK